jgi:pimeloyl-ACP methyl ester carboxylesterase
MRPSRSTAVPRLPMEQELGSTRLPGGTTIAYATAGGGPFLLFIGGWLSHLELSWALPAERHLFEGLARGRTVIRYDRPGCGLSDRPTQASASLESELEVVAAVIKAWHSSERRIDLAGGSPLVVFVPAA